MTTAHQGWTVPGWYTDPSGHFRLRYHDGAGWTLHVFDEVDGTIDDLPVDQLYGLLPPASVAVDPPAGPWGDALLDVESCTLGPLPEGVSHRPINDREGVTIGWVTAGGSDNPMATLSQVSRLQADRRDLVGPDGAFRLRFEIPVSVFTPEITVRDVRGSELGKVVQKTSGPCRFSMSAQGVHEGVVEFDGTTAVARDSGGQPTAVVSESGIDTQTIRFVRSARPEVRALLLACLVGWDTISGTAERSFSTPA